MKCPACESAVPHGATACPWCGAKFVEALKPGPVMAQAGAAECRNHPGRQATPCARCGTFQCSECFTVGGQLGTLCASCREFASDLPWDRRAELGTWRAYWQTSVAVIGSPIQTFQRAKPDAPLGDSLLLAGVSGFVGFATTLLLYMLFAAGMLLFSASELGKVAGETKLQGGALAGIGVGVVVIYIAMIFVMQMASVLAISGIEHGCLRLLGHREGSYSVTVRAHALAMGPYLIGLIPLCSLYVYPLWSLVLRIFAMQHLHRTTGGKAAGAVLLPIAVLIALCGVGYVMLFAAMIGAGALAGTK